MGDAPSRRAGLRVSLALGQHVFDAEPGLLRYEQDGGRVWVLSWQHLVFAEVAIPRAELLAELLARAGEPVPEIPDLGREPRHELLRLLGCAMEVRADRGGLVVHADEHGRTSQPGITIAGPEIWGTPIPDAAWGFLTALPAICPCEGVTFADVDRVARELGLGARAVKAHTRAGAGTGCQGAFCRTPIQTWMELRHGHCPERIAAPAARAPLTPVSIRSWLDAARGEGS